MSTSDRNREAWLNALADSVRPWFAEHNYVLPPFRASCGFPSRSPLSRQQRRIGECWDGSVSRSGHAEIFISPVLDDGVEVSATLVHELVHAAVGSQHGHKAPFNRMARALGLEGKPTATVAGDAFKRRVGPILTELGQYPHARMSVERKGKVQSTRLLKAFCSDCGYTVRVTAKWLEVGPPSCPQHGEMRTDGWPR